MRKKALSGIMLTLLLIGYLTFAFNIQPVKASETIYIRPDGSVEGTNMIQRDGDVYTFTGSIYDSIVLERDNIVVNGGGYTLQGTGPPGNGIDLTGRSNVTIKNLEIKGFYFGINLNMSSSNIISENNITNNYPGIYLYSSWNNTLSRNNITANNWSGIHLDESSNNRISGNIIRVNGGDGVYLGYYSNSNNVTRNIVSNNYRGVCLARCSDNNVSINIASRNWGGIHLVFSGSNTLTGNNMTDNEYNFGVYGSVLPHFIQDIDISNIADEKPVYYLVNQENFIIEPSTLPQIGYLGLVNSTNIVVRDLTLIKNHEGLLFAYVTNSIIENVTTSNNLNGISFVGSSCNIITRSTSSNNGYRGIWLFGSNDNNVSGSMISRNSQGMSLEYSNFNTIHHNALVDNIEQVYSAASINTWDNGYPSGGNYWSDYPSRYPTVKDEYQGPDQDILGRDWIWDSPYFIDTQNHDRYPLTNPWENILPVADAGLDQTVYEDALVIFDGSGSSDNIGIRSYVWTFTDVIPQTLMGVNPTYTFNTPGVYTVTLNVTDASGNWATDTVTITVLSLTPEDLTQRLIETIETWNLPKGTENSLISKLEGALHLLEVGNENGAVHKLMDFICQVEALRDKKLTHEQADYLISEAQRIIDLIYG